jgi:hypothetical protein
MKFAVIVPRILGQWYTVGPFDHEEDAEAWAHKNITHAVWKVAMLYPKEDASAVS